MMMLATGWGRAALGLCGAVLGGAVLGAVSGGRAGAQAPPAWEPRQTIQFIVPASRGGGADQMARLIRDIAAKHDLAKQPILVVNRAGQSGFNELKAARGEPHSVLISLSSIFTAPLLGRGAVGWRDLTPVAQLALDEFVLWVDADAPYRTVPDFLAAARRTDPARRFRMGGTGTGQEDQIITQAVERAGGVEFAYVAHRGGSEVASQLMAGNLEATVNNPAEALPGWRAGSLRPLCVFDDRRLTSPERPTPGMGWADIPTCKEAGLDVDYSMMRTLFMAPGAEPAQVAYYVDLMRRVRETPDWAAYMRAGAFDPAFVTGPELAQKLAREEERHRAIVSGGGLSIQSLQGATPLGLTTAVSGQEN